MLSLHYFQLNVCVHICILTVWGVELWWCLLTCSWWFLSGEEDCFKTTAKLAANVLQRFKNIYTPKHLKGLISSTHLYQTHIIHQAEIEHIGAISVHLYIRFKGPLILCCALVLFNLEVSTPPHPPKEKEAETSLPSWNRMCFISDIPSSDLVLSLIV